MILRTALVLACIAVCGCSKPPYEIAHVDGVLTIKGKPGDKVSIQFVPDIDKGTKGPMSVAETDDQGHFTLRLMTPKAAESTPGAVVGWHRVVLSDLRMAASATGLGVPVRLPPGSSLAGSTKLRQEVKPGAQTITIDLP